MVPKSGCFCKSPAAVPGCGEVPGEALHSTIVSRGLRTVRFSLLAPSPPCPVLQQTALPR